MLGSTVFFIAVRIVVPVHDHNTQVMLDAICILSSRFSHFVFKKGVLEVKCSFLS